MRTQQRRADVDERRIELPWIRAMPLTSVRGLRVSIDRDEVRAPDLRVVLGSGALEPDALGDVPSQWFLQDRLVLAGDRTLSPGSHAVSVDFRLLVPYLHAGPGAPLVLPLQLEANLILDSSALPSVSRDVA